MNKQELIVDPGFVHHRKIETIFGQQGSAVLNDDISRLSTSAPEWQKKVAIDHIYTRRLLEFCKINEIKTLEQVLFDDCGRLFCSILRLKPCGGLYDSERAIIECEPFENSEKAVELHLTTSRITGSTLKSHLGDGGEFAVVAEFFKLDGSTLIFHPLLIGFPYIGDPKTHELSWVHKYGEFYNVHLEDFDEFSKVKEFPFPSSFEDMEQISESAFKKAIGKVLAESTPKDWGGEMSDFVTSHLHIDGQRVRAAFLLKGPAKFSPMTAKHLGKNGDQIYRLSQEPADVLIVQHCHDITSAVVGTLKALATQPSNPRYYCLVNGRESLRLLEAFWLKQWALDETKKG
jgi:hypothetical protein